MRRRRPRPPGPRAAERATRVERRTAGAGRARRGQLRDGSAQRRAARRPGSKRITERQARRGQGSPVVNYLVLVMMLILACLVIFVGLPILAIAVIRWLIS